MEKIYPMVRRKRRPLAPVEGSGIPAAKRRVVPLVAGAEPPAARKQVNYGGGAR